MWLYLYCGRVLFISAVLFFLSGCYTSEHVPGYAHRYRGKNASAQARSAIKFQETKTQASAPLEPIELRAAEEVLPINLPTTLRIAADENLDIALAKSRVEEAEGERDAAKLKLLPTLSASLLRRHTSGTLQGSFGNFQRPTFDTVNPEGDLRLSMNPGQAVFQAAAASKALEATHSNASQVVQNTLLIAAQQYFDLQAAQSQINIAEKAVTQSRELLRITEMLEKQGAGLKVDVFRAETRLQSDIQGLLVAKNEFRLASLELALTLKIEPTVVLSPKDTEVRQITIVDPALTPDQLVDIAIEKRPEAQEAYLQVESADAAKKAAWWEAFGPGVDVGGKVGGIGPTFGDITSRSILDGFVGWTLSGSAIGRVKSAKAQLQEHRIREKIVQESIKSDVVKAYEEVLVAREQISTTEKGLIAAEKTLDISQNRLKHGEGITLEVLQAQEALTKAQTDYVRAIVKYNNAQFQLLNALGELSMEGLLDTTIFSQGSR